MISRFNKFVFHPVIFAGYPILALMAHNLGQIGPVAGFRFLGAAVLTALVLWLLLSLVFKNWSKAGLVVSLWMLLLFSYGHIYHFLETHPILGLSLGRHRVLLVVWLLLFGAGTWLIVRIKGEMSKLTQMLNLVTIVLLSFSLYQFAAHAVKMGQAEVMPTALSDIPYGLNLPAGTLPDIYYIILDGYPRQDVLERRAGIDNTPFLDELRSLGFYVAECSQSNYAQTELSLATSLNFNYLEDLGEKFTTENVDRYDLFPLIQHSQVRQILASMGYHLVAFETGHPWTTILDAEYYFARKSQPLSTNQSWLKVNGLELMILNSSMGLVVTDSILTFSKEIADLDYPTQENRERVLYTMDMMHNVPLDVPSPKFVFAHIVSPHFPVVFGPNGEYELVLMDVDDETYAKGYQGQIAYVNKRVIQIIRNIFTVSVTPPIIILQSDHGYDRFLEVERTFNLNALYLPNGQYDQLYPEITPVNTFRIIFSEYFGGDFELLEDRAYFSLYRSPYDLTLIPNSCEP